MVTVALACLSLSTAPEPERQFYDVEGLASLSYFGGSVAIDDETVLIGAFLETRDQTDSGAAYLMDRDTGELIAELRPDTPAGSESFGSTVGLWNGIAFVGCAVDAARGNSGALYMFDASTGEQIDVITPKDTDSTDYYGAYFDIWGNFMAVTAVVHNYPGEDSGRIYLYDLNTMQLVREYVDTNQHASTIGREIALTDQHVLTYRIADLDNEPADTNLIIFDRDTGAIVADVVVARHPSYSSLVRLDADSNVALVGDANSNLFGENSGAIHVFDLGRLEFVHVFGPGLSEPSAFGVRIDIGGDYAAISAPAAPNQDQILKGAVEIYDMRTWQRVTTIVPNRHPLTGYAQGFGYDINLTASGLLAGVPGAFSHVQYIPIPELCPADVNRDCLVDTADFTAWINAFNNSFPECDQNGDGTCTPTDFTAWIANFNAGC